MADDYPNGAYLLLLIAGILELIYAAVAVFFVSISLIVPIEGMMMGVIIGICVVWFLIWGILLILSAVWVKSGDPDKVHKGGIMGLISAILGAPGFYGLVFILGLIGAILALTWKKQPRMAAPPPPPPPM